MSEELKRCPFCGGEATIAPEMSGPLSPGRVLGCDIGCDGDGCPGNIGRSYLYPSEKVATEAWNRRAESTCHYVYDKEISAWRCSECGGLEPVGDHVRYCPDCGARVVDE